MKFKFFPMMLALLMVSGPALSADLDSPSAPTDPGSAMFTIEDIYNRLNDGTEGTRRSGPFAGPTSGPSSAGHTLDDVMDKSPQKDDANGATADDVAEGKKFWGLTGGKWGLQTGTAAGGGSSYPAPFLPLAKTGDSADGGKGAAWPDPRFTDNGDETVTDNLTSLMWTKNANMAINSWEEAKSYCEDLSYAGHDDWHLPDRNELSSLIDRSKHNPALPGGHPFSDVQNGYWSSTAYSGGTSFAWFVSLNVGVVNGGVKTDTVVVWPVRGGQ